MTNFIKNIALAILISISTIATAQLPDGSIAPDFTTTDVNGNVHRLYDYLDDGYTVILDISATWCGPCWNYHTGGTFEEIWEDHGPAGEPGVSPNTTDDVMILWFEGDPTTALSELENSTYGNWLNPNGDGEIQFPIINDDNIADLYDLPYWPIIYTICPNRRLSESGQLNTSSHYSALDDCLAPSVGTNAALLNIQSNISGCEGNANGNLSVVVQNMGTEQLTSFTVEVLTNGQSIASEVFNGTLNIFETTTIDFGNLTIDTETIEVIIATNDANSLDNSLTESYSFGSGETEAEVTVVLLTDDFASEIYMQISDENGNIVWSEGNENVAGNYDTGQENPAADPTNALENNQTYEWTVTLPAENCHTFFIGDYYGDGLDASQWGGSNGNWTVKNNNGSTIAQMTVADFEGSDDASFLNTLAGNPSSIDKNDSFNFDFTIYPNPMNSKATININLTESSDVRLDIVNILGEVNLSSTFNLNTGYNSIDFDVSSLNSGIYFAHLTTNGETETMKITVTK